MPLFEQKPNLSGFINFSKKRFNGPILQSSTVGMLNTTEHFNQGFIRLDLMVLLRQVASTKFELKTFHIALVIDSGLCTLIRPSSEYQ